MEHAIADMERRRYEAMKQADIAGYFRYESISIEEQSTLVLSDVALLRGRMRARGLLNGSPLTLDNRFLAVVCYSGGQWRLLSYQPTPVR
jgi:Domain of unknown function (DUF4440)